MTSMPALKEMPINIRPADPDDFLEMAEFGRGWYEQTEYATLAPYSTESVLRELERLHEAGLLLVATNYLDIIGFIGAVTGPFYANESVLAGSERFFWVHPDHRGSGVAQKLLAAMERLAKNKGCVVWSMIAMQCMRPEQVGAFYEKLGYRWTERTYTKVL